MTGFGSSHKPEETPKRTPGDDRRGRPLSPLHLPHMHLPHLPHLHLPRLGADGDHPMLDALTHSLDLAGRGYCCAANPLEAEQAATRETRTRETRTGETQAQESRINGGGSAAEKGARGAKLSGK